MERKIKLYLILGSCLLLVAVLAILNIAICFNPFDSGGCIAVIYDKAAMRAADKIVLCVGENRYEITNDNFSDAVFIDWITADLMVATHTALRHVKTDRWLEIYSGDTLVRRMNWASCADETGVFIYEEDFSHQIYHGYYSGGSDYGMIFPSDAVVEKLNAIIVEAENAAQ